MLFTSTSVLGIFESRFVRNETILEPADIWMFGGMQFKHISGKKVHEMGENARIKYIFYRSTVCLCFVWPKNRFDGTKANAQLPVNPNPVNMQ